MDKNNLKIKYALELFKYHADQRYKLFNLYIILLGAHFAAFGTLKSYLDYLSLSLIVFSILFYFLEVRNRQLIHIAENVMINLEKNWLFKEEITNFEHDKGIIATNGILYRDSKKINENSTIGTQIKELMIRERDLYKHSTIFDLMYALAIISSIVIIILISFYR